MVWHRVCRQQQTSVMSGHYLGLRFEAVIAALDWYTRAGRVSDPDEVLDRISILDDLFCRFHNDRVDAAAKAPPPPPDRLTE